MSYSPQPRDGLLGAWDRFVGPGMTRPETALVIASAVVGAVVAWLTLAAEGHGWPLLLIGTVIAFDVIGGAVCNMTETTKRWYHRPGLTARDQFGFIALHVLHIGAVAVLFRGPGIDFAFAAVFSGFLILSALAVLAVPQMVRSPLAAFCFIVALGLANHVLGTTPGMEWFIPLLFLKLLIGHAVPPTLRE